MKRPISAALLALALAAPAAQANTLTTTASYATQSTDATAQLLELPLFDSTLGELTGVTLGFGGSMSSSSSVVNTSAALNLTLVNVSVSGDFTATLAGGPGALPGSVDLIAPGAGGFSHQFTILGPGAHTAVGPFVTTLAPGPSFSFSAAADLAGFTGAGTLGYLFSSHTTASVPARFTSVQLSPSSTTSAELSVTYTFTPADVPPVPEPQSWALFLCGLAGGSVFLRRRLARQDGA